MKKLNKINVLGFEYKIEYVDKPSEVDIYKKESLWGQIDYWTRTIRIYDNGRTEQDIFQTLLHETLHAIEDSLHMTCFENDEGHNQLDMLAMALADVLVRNNIVSLEEPKKKENK